MDLWIIAAVVMLVGWAVATVAYTAPGWIHLFLILGVFIVLWRIVVHGTPDPKDRD